MNQVSPAASKALNKKALKRKAKPFADFRAHKTYYFMLLPLFAYFIAFNYLPLAGLYNAFTNYDFSKGLLSPFVGLQNFEFLFKGGADSIIWKLTRNTILYNVAFIILSNVCQIGMAVLLKEIAFKRFVKTSQTLMFMPYFVSMVIIGSIIYNLFNFNYGVLNNMFTSLGMEKFDFYRTPGSGRSSLLSLRSGRAWAMERSFIWLPLWGSTRAFMRPLTWTELPNGSASGMLPFRCSSRRSLFCCCSRLAAY